MNGVAGRRSPVAGQTTIQTLLDWVDRELTAVGVPNPRVDAEWLLAHLLGVRRDYLRMHSDHIISDAQHAQFIQYAARRRSREPLQYILGTQEFYGRTFQVTRDVLIPRPETELLVERAIQGIRGLGLGIRKNPHPLSPIPSPQILEIGTGSGCIAITLALECPAAHITATDISPAALAIARTNAAAHGVADRITFQEESISHIVHRTSSPQAQNTTYDIRYTKYDLIISNPPYCPAPQWPTLQPEVRDFEPRHAIVGGKDGLDFIRAIIQDAPRQLKPGGTLFLEIGDGQADAVKGMIATTGAYKKPTVYTDYNGIERIVAVTGDRRPTTGD